MLTAETEVHGSNSLEVKIAI